MVYPEASTRLSSSGFLWNIFISSLVASEPRSTVAAVVDFNNYTRNFVDNIKIRYISGQDTWKQWMVIECRKGIKGQLIVAKVKGDLELAGEITYVRTLKN